MPANTLEELTDNFYNKINDQFESPLLAHVATLMVINVANTKCPNIELTRRLATPHLEGAIKELAILSTGLEATEAAEELIKAFEYPQAASSVG